jgi:hypothetical protein
MVGVRREGEKNMSVLDRLIQICRKKISFWFIILLLSFTVNVEAAKITPDTRFVVGNEHTLTSIVFW